MKCKLNDEEEEEEKEEEEVEVVDEEEEVGHGLTTPLNRPCGLEFRCGWLTLLALITAAYRLCAASSASASSGIFQYSGDDWSRLCVDHRAGFFQDSSGRWKDPGGKKELLKKETFSRI